MRAAFIRWQNRRFLKRMERLKWRIRDEEADLSKWGFAYSPSKRHKTRERIERMEAEYEAMKAQVPEHE